MSTSSPRYLTIARSHLDHINVRPLRSHSDEDLRTVSAIAALCRRSRFVAGPLAALRQNAKSHLGRLAGINDEAVGYAILRRLGRGNEPTELEVLDLAVAPKWRRSGVARRLLQPFVLEALDGKYKLFVVVPERNLAAELFLRDFFGSEPPKRSAFRHVKTLPNYYPDLRQDGYLMMIERLVPLELAKH